MTRSPCVFGLVDSPAQADRVVAALLDKGHASDDISALLPDQRAGASFEHHRHNRAPVWATLGWHAGGILGGVCGWLIASGVLTFPGAAGIRSAGMLVAVLCVAGAGGLIGACLGWLFGARLPKIVAERHEGLMPKGQILVSVFTDSEDQIAEAKGILKALGAHHISATTDAPARKPVGVLTPAEQQAAPGRKSSA